MAAHQPEKLAELVQLQYFPLKISRVISKQKYSELIFFAKKIIGSTNFEPLDIVHDALAENQDATFLDVKNAYWKNFRRSKEFIPYQEKEKKSRYPNRQRICRVCKNIFSCAAFTYSNGKLHTCDKCHVKGSIKYAKNNKERVKGIYKKYYERIRLQVNEKKRLDYQLNPEERKKYLREWRLKNKKKVKLYRQKDWKKKKLKKKQNTSVVQLGA